MQKKLELYLDGKPENKIDFIAKKIINAGYTGRNQEEVQKHIQELKALGVPAPEKVPVFYQKSASLITTGNCCDVVDDGSTGEAEYALLVAKDAIYVAVGSDHTDRKLETYNIPKAKHICPNFISQEVWKLEDVKEHWDEIEIRSWIGKGREKLYQKATLDKLIHPDELLNTVSKILKNGLEEGTVIFSGTVGALIEGMPFSNYFEVELMDKKRNRSLNCSYQINIMDWIKE